MLFSRVEEELDEETLGAFEAADSLLRVRMEAAEEEQMTEQEETGE